ncbi:oxidoreductase family protein [Perilla frutescens var. hirtella]|nr:oxidoreductase family protein [Perilla frutescens var. hirtella]
MVMISMDAYIYGCVGAASFFGSILLYKYMRRKTKAAEEFIESTSSAHQRGDAEIIIVGAGVAGAALSYTLGKDGRRVLVIERDLTEPSRIVGEHLLPAGYLNLIDLDLQDCLRDIDAQPVYGYVFFKEGKDIRLSYPREKLDSKGTVTSLINEEGTVKGVQYKTKNGEQINAYAPLTIVCDGCFSNLRRSLSSPQDHLSFIVGLLLENCDLPHAHYGHIVLGDPSPITFNRISSTEIRCLVDIPRQKLPSSSNDEMAHYLRTVVAPQIPPQLYDSFIAAIQKGNIKIASTRSMAANPHPTPGALLLGALNMRHPITGGGMTVALYDILLLRNLLRPIDDLYDAPTLSNYIQSFYAIRKPRASTINILAESAYKLFCASPDPAMQELRQACFNYMSLGGIFSRNSISLLSGLCLHPLILFLNFSTIAVYALGRLVLPFPTPQKVWLGTRMLFRAFGVIFPIIKAQGIRHLFLPATGPTYYRARK